MHSCINIKNAPVFGLPGAVCLWMHTTWQREQAGECMYKLMETPINSQGGASWVPAIKNRERDRVNKEEHFIQGMCGSTLVKKKNSLGV